MPQTQHVNLPARRSLRLTCGTALSLALSFGLALPIPFIAPMLTVIVLSSMPRPLPLKAMLSLPLIAALTTGAGLLLIPLLHHAPLSALLLVLLGLFLSFRYGLRGGNPLLTIFLVIGLTMISAAGRFEFALGSMVVEALLKGLLVCLLIVWVSHQLFAEPPNAPLASAPQPTSSTEINWIALRGALVVLPAYLLALLNPASYMPLIMQSVNLGQQACGINARQAGRELLGSTLLGGLLAIMLWTALSLFTHLWLFFLWTLLFSLLVARKRYGLSPSKLSPGFWQNSLTTMLLLLGQSVQDSVVGKDVYSAFAIRMALFIAVTLYACAAVYLLDAYRKTPLSRTTTT